MTMKTTIEISDADAADIKELLQRANVSGDRNTHGRLTMKRLAEMLMQDAALAVRRPGSWEGANMARVLASHGYEV